MKRFTLVCVDMAGTTVRDDGIVEQAASAALEECGLQAGGEAHDKAMAYVRATTGTSKIEVFRSICSHEDAAQLANLAFERAIATWAADGRIAALPYADETLKSLRAKGIRVALTTGFSPRTQQAIIRALGWEDAVDLAIAPGSGLRGRPFPDMILHAVLTLGIADVRQVAVVGDSVGDLYSGLRAGATLVAGVTTGSHDTNALREAGATHVLSHIGELPTLVGG
ncbi:MAG TPA: HAD-IA family hydrolase [Stackebrandtia sp.]|uniref:HAD-IA family hydrolase n=1 Tax=Stackebrandtia sp. TaxID=2023065 RepID=UPI002D5D6EBA|nr:HAD-IA family hydrolase [Stackebrandtia sp.]HZE37291.1 HAD-IA family hydrolase [Stackebrandtia sp.]